MVIEKYSLILTPSLRQKTTKYMTKSYYFQVMPACISHTYCCGIFAYLNLGNSTIAVNCSGFLRIINPFINKNLYYENKF